MYAMDRHYWPGPSSDRSRWKSILGEAREVFQGELVSPFSMAGCRRERFRICHNSGVGAIALAAHWKAERIILVGYDCQKGPEGEKHHHPDHPKPLGNCGSMKLWPAMFKRLAAELRGQVEIVNATRRTAIDCWPIIDLETALEQTEGATADVDI